MAVPEPSDDALRQALTSEALPEPREEARRQALAAALEAFDAESRKISQGSAPPRRPIFQLTRLFNLLGDWNMTPRTLALAASAALGLFLVVTFAPPEHPIWLGTAEQPVATRPVPSPTDDRTPPSSAPPTPVEKETATPSPEPREVTEGRPAHTPPPATTAAREEAPGPAAAPAPVREPTPLPAAPVAAPPLPGDHAPPEPASPAKGRGWTGAPPSPPATPAAQPHEVARKSAPQLLKTPGTAVGGMPGGVHAPPLAERAPPPSATGEARALAPRTREEEERDRFTPLAENPVQVAAEEPVSTFSADVDTASYTFVRRLLNQGRLPPPDAVRVEEMINYFHYDHAAPREPTEPFALTLALHPTPWNPDTRLLHIGIKGYELPARARPRIHLTFLVDVSGSMNAPDKLPLLKQSLGLLVQTLEPEDTVAIVTYAGAAGTVLEPTPVRERHTILEALERLSSGGSTAGGEGIRRAYALARGSYDPNGVNRVILATDGDFNVGIADPRALKGLVAEQRQSGILLSVLGFGQGNYHDALMQELAQNGNGVAAYIDTLAEARKVLVEEATANLFTIARDVKFQVEFNPARVAEYRLIGYQTRRLAREDFRNDRVDAGDVGSGHTVTALYEVTPRGSAATLVEPLRYGGQAPGEPSPVVDQDAEWAFVKIRYKLPEGETSRLMSRPVTQKVVVTELERASDDLRFAAAVAAFGERLRGGRHLGGFGYDGIIQLARDAKGRDESGHRAEFVNLVRMAKALAGE